MDFDLDDPLADLLSDGSNNSFFETTSKPKLSTDLDDSKSKTRNVANLFGIDHETAQTTTTASSEIIKRPNSPKPNPGPASSSKTSSSVPGIGNLNTGLDKGSVTKGVTVKLASKIKFEDSDDFLNELGFDIKNPKIPISKTSSKINLLDDILNIGKDSRQKTPTKGEETDKSPSRNDPAAPAASDKISNRYSPQIGRRKSQPQMDSDTNPLDLFSMHAKQTRVGTDRGESVGRPKPKSAMKAVAVDWLGLDLEPSLEAIALKPDQNTQSVSSDIKIPSASVPASSSTPLVFTNSIETPAAIIPDSIKNVDLFAVTSMEKEQAQSMQQQEIQLRTATQIKQQENILVDIYQKQQTLIKQQETQFNDLLRRQIDRQTQLEAHICKQQEQINSYINVLLSQPALGALTPTENILMTSAAREHTKMSVCSNKSAESTSQQIAIELETEVKRLKLENLRLEDVLQNVRSAHDQELSLLEASHAKQVKLLEENLECLEHRLRGENESIASYYNTKMNALSSEADTQQRKYEEQISKIIADYEKRMEKLRFDYDADIEAIKNDQRMTIENIRQAKLYEFGALQESGSYLNTLKAASIQLETASDNLKSMRTSMDFNIERVQAERTAQLAAKEDRLNDQQKNIDKMMEKTEAERLQLIELVRTLEVKLHSVEQSSAEEQWALRQKNATLDAERTSFDRERAFVREKQAEEEKRIMEIKEMQMNEHKRLMDMIDEERHKILVERAKLETMERLKPKSNSTLDQGQKELDAAIQIAQEGVRQNEFKKRELMDKENALRSKQCELESSIQQANDQKRIAERATALCRSLEQQFVVKLQTLQQNYADLADREAKLSYTKMGLSQERVKLANLQNQLRRSKCSLCRIGEQAKDLNESDRLANLVGSNDEPQLNVAAFETMKFTDDFEPFPTVDELLTTKFNSIVPNILMTSRQLDLSDSLSFRNVDFDSDLRSVNLNLVGTETLGTIDAAQKNCF